MVLCSNYDNDADACNSIKNEAEEGIIVVYICVNVFHFFFQKVASMLEVFALKRIVLVHHLKMRRLSA
jgi:hypothetical protein